LINDDSMKGIFHLEKYAIPSTTFVSYGLAPEGRTERLREWYTFYRNDFCAFQQILREADGQLLIAERKDGTSAISISFEQLIDP